MLPTPLGDITTLDLDDPVTQETVLYHDKHQLLEGLVVEDVVDQILDQMMARQRSLSRLNVVSVVAASKGATTRTVFVLDQGASRDELNLYLARLQHEFLVRLVRYDAGSRDFVTHAGPNAWDGPLEVSLGDALREREPNPHFCKIDESIKDAMRQRRGFWGYLSGSCKSKLGRAVVLPRLFKNFAVQPYFDGGVWDVDRVLLGKSGRFYVMEVKHKFPFGAGRLKFGINRGSANVLYALSRTGFCCFHAIMVKPYWDDMHSVTYLFNELETRKRVVFCGRIFTESELQELLRQPSSRSPAKTSLTGSRTLDYVSFHASSLYRIGSLDDPELPAQFARALIGQLPEHISDEDLRSSRMRRGKPE